VVGVDISERCCRLARINAAVFGLGARAAFVEGDAAESTWDSTGLQERVLSAFQDPVDRGTVAPADLVVMNPPYIPPAELAAISPHVIRSDGISALAGGGTDGLALPIRIVCAVAASRAVRPGAIIAMELQQDQPKALRRWLHGQYDCTGEHKPCPSNLRWLSGGLDLFGSLRFAFMAVT
jgi:release factor glutamine methyltransferase